jgi:valyl-tRNA synthetase
MAPLDKSRLQAVDRWILHRLNDTIESVSNFLDGYDFGEAGRRLYNFAWDDFCDWYIEFAKLSLYGQDAEMKLQTQAVLHTVLDGLLRLLHPFIPFVTEEIWRSLPQREQALIVTQWPQTQAQWVSVEAEKEVGLVQEVVRAGRNIRSELGISPGREITMEIQTEQSDTESILIRSRLYIQRFCHVADLVIHTQGDIPRLALSAVVSGAQLYVPLAGLVDVGTELERLGKDVVRLQGEVQRAEKKLNNSKFVEKAPSDVVTSERNKLVDYQEKLQRVRQRMDWFQSQ